MVWSWLELHAATNTDTWHLHTTIQMTLANRTASGREAVLLHRLPEQAKPDLCGSSMQHQVVKLSKVRKWFLSHQEASLAGAGSCGMVDEGLGFWAGGDMGIRFIIFVTLCVYPVRAL